MRTLKTLIGIFFLVFATLTCAQDIREGREYTVLNPPQQVENKGKIEVLEFFWYGCPHCYDFEPLLQKWLKALPKDVVFRRVPALFPGDKWLTDTKTYYTLEAMGLLEKMHQEVFDAIHIDRVRMNDENTLFAWMEKKGVDRKKFEDTFRSFAVQSKAQRSMQLSGAYGLDGVPALIVQGKYKPVPGASGSYGDVLVTVDKLIARVRAEQGKK